MPKPNGRAYRPIPKGLLPFSRAAEIPPGRIPYGLRVTLVLRVTFASKLVAFSCCSDVLSFGSPTVQGRVWYCSLPNFDMLPVECPSPTDARSRADPERVVAVPARYRISARAYSLWVACHLGLVARS